MIHLDTSFLIRALVDGTPQSKKLDDWVKDGIDLRVSAPAWCEFLCGPVSADDIALAQAAMGTPLSFEAEDAITASGLFNSTGRRRGSLIDCMIAAVSIRAQTPIATDNIEDFRRFEPMGLRFA
jgi:predicted nucleic acid-binding protein